MFCHAVSVQQILPNYHEAQQNLEYFSQIQPQAIYVVNNFDGKILMYIPVCSNSIHFKGKF